jgi:hypothetical protein
LEATIVVRHSDTVPAPGGTNEITKPRKLRVATSVARVR